MKSHLEAGALAEQWACEYLQRRGLKLLGRNYRCRMGEIDIIMRDAETVVFVEVRFRSHPGFGGALASIDARKQSRILAAASHYLQRHELRCPTRIDVVGVRARNRIDWLSNAIESAW
ncbi:MAG: YraN family protein [Pseudomonadota bacterium]|nr:YraN family protein [Pseudomonadota bacterium]